MQSNYLLCCVTIGGWGYCWGVAESANIAFRHNLSLFICLDAEQRNNEQSSTVNGDDQSDGSISQSHSAQQLSSGGHVAQERRDKINYQYLMMAIPQSDEKKRFSLGQKSNSGLSNEQQQIDSFLQDSWATDKPPHPAAPQRQLSSVTIDPGDLATDSKSLRRGASHDYQNVSFDDEESPKLKSPGSCSLRFSKSMDATSPTANSQPHSANSKPQSTDPFLCDSWAAQSSSTIATSNPSKVVPIATASDKSVAQSLPEYENVWFSDSPDHHDNDDDDDDDDDGMNGDVQQEAPLQIDFSDIIDAIDNKQQQKKKQESSVDNQECDRKQSNYERDPNHHDDDYHDYHKGPITVKSQPIQRSNSIVLSSGSHADPVTGSHTDPVSGDPDYENYGSDEDYANVFDTPSTPANQKSSNAYDKLELKSSSSNKCDTLSGRGFSLTGSENGSHNELLGSHELVESNDNPFAGLVITASSMMSSRSCHDDLTRSMARSVIRRSNASCLDDSNRHSLWSSDRVEQEFDQVS